MGAPRSTSIENFRNQQQLRKNSMIEKEMVSWKQISATFIPLIFIASVLIVLAIFLPIFLVVISG